MKLFLSVLLVLSCCPLNAQTYGNFKDVIFLYCFDGDTCTVTIQNIPEIFGKKISVRLKGIDTPEIRGKCPDEKRKALESKKFINSYLKNAKRIDLENTERGKYFRILANIVADGKDLSTLMIEKGLARPYQGEKRKGWCK
jgi:micrococcal nuclease